MMQSWAQRHIATDSQVVVVPCGKVVAANAALRHTLLASALDDAPRTHAVRLCDESGFGGRRLTVTHDGCAKDIAVVPQQTGATSLPLGTDRTGLPPFVAVALNVLPGRNK